MNKFALTTVAALPGSGGGASAWQAPEVVRKEARPSTCSHDAVYIDDVKSHMEDAIVWGPAATGSYRVVVPAAEINTMGHMEDAIKRAEWKRNNHAMLYGNRRAARIADMEERLANPLSFADYEAAWKEIASEPELEEYFSSPT